MEKNRQLLPQTPLQKEQIRELAVKSLAGIKNSYAPLFSFPRISRTSL